MAKKNEFTRPKNPPSPLFVNQPERDLAKQITIESMERVIGNRILYYSIDMQSSNFHPLYGECIQKTFLPPVMVYVLMDFGQTYKETRVDKFGLEKDSHAIVHFHSRRLQEDLNVYVREGDFILYNQIVYEIVKLTQPTAPFGQPEMSIEISATVIKSRKGNFQAT